MTAQEVKDALRRRHPALGDYVGPGPWTTLEEWENIDLLAFSAWSSKKPPIVGYEVKISRSDYRREVLRPDKRAKAVAMCWEFYFATPKGLLTKDEKAYVEPEHFADATAFVREKCPQRCHRSGDSSYTLERMPPVEVARRRKTGQEFWEPVALGDECCMVNPWPGEGKRGDVMKPRYGGHTYRWEVCETCAGRGYLEKSVVEIEAPTLWIPKDVGLIEVDDEGRSRVIRKAPRNEPTRLIGDLGQLVRWVSYRPDPRHVEEREAKRPTMLAAA